MNGFQLARNLDANGRGRRLEQTAKNARGRGSASANKERGRVWNAIGITHFTSCNSNSTSSTNDINYSNKADPYPHNNPMHTITIITSSITTTQCRHPYPPRTITTSRGIL